MIAEWYASVRIDTTGVPEATALALSLPRGSRVLDIGCGNGIPLTKALLSGEHRIVSLDSSGAMLRHFRFNYPAMPAVQAMVQSCPFIDAVFVGMQLEPPGTPWFATALLAWVLDLPFVLLLLVLARKVSHRRVRATQVGFWLYAIDTFVFLLSFAASLAVFRAAVRQLAWQGLTLILHGVGLFILFRAWRAAVGAQRLA